MPNAFLYSKGDVSNSLALIIAIKININGLMFLTHMELI